MQDAGDSPRYFLREIGAELSNATACITWEDPARLGIAVINPQPLEAQSLMNLFAISRRLFKWRARLGWIAMLGVAHLGNAHALDVRVARQYGVAYIPLMVMQEKKLIEKHAAQLGVADVNVVWQQFSGGAVMNDALISGNLDFAVVGPPPFLTMWARTRGTLQQHQALARRRPCRGEPWRSWSLLLRLLLRQWRGRHLLVRGSTPRAGRCRPARCRAYCTSRRTRPSAPRRT